ncbi:MAG TPA: hypothetical protein VMU41_19615 [Candidatus Binataceae bacterium]|nr:hypothetical protein [Candidatus Binataceae bacterium]
MDDAEFGATSAAQNRVFAELIAIPDTRRMVSLRLMAKETGIISPATGKFNRHDIKRTSIVSTPRTGINLNPVHRHSRDSNRQFLFRLRKLARREI